MHVHSIGKRRRGGGGGWKQYTTGKNTAANENKMMVMLMDRKPKGASILTLFKRLKLRTLCVYLNALS